MPYCRCNEATKKKHQLHPGDLLFARVGATTGKSFLVRRCPDAVYASYLIRVRAKTVDPAFLYYFCNSEMYWRQINASKGDKLKGGVSGSVLAQVRHCLPPLLEQRAIAAVLSKIQAAVEVQDKIVATLKELKAATTTKLFREGLRCEPLKQTEVGEIPGSWGVVQVGDYCERPRYGYTESACSNPIGPKFLRITDITEYGVDWDSVPYCLCPQTTLDEFRLEPGDLVFARIGATTGKSYLITDCPESVFASYLIRLRTKPSLDPIYLSCFFESEAYWRQVRANKGNNLKGGMSAAILASLLFPLPPQDEQQEIAVTLKTIERRIALVVKQRDALKFLFSSMLHLLMTGQVRVNHLNLPEVAAA